MNKSILVGFFALVSTFYSGGCLSYGAYNNIIWGGAGTAAEPEVTISSFGQNDLTATVNVTPVSGFFSLKVIGSECSNFPIPPSELPNKNHTTQWLMVPDKITDGASGATLSFDFQSGSGTWWGHPAETLGGQAGWNLISFDKEYFSENYADGCLDLGTIRGVNITSAGTGITGKLKLDPNKAKPGIYSLGMDLGWAFEENKYSGSIAGNAWSHIGAMIWSSGRFHKTITFTVPTRCSYSAAEKTLNHGTISLKKGVKFWEAKDYLSMTCILGKTSVHVSLKGLDPVVGKGINVTKCGEGGYCELTFDANDKVDAFDEMLTVDKSEEILIRSRYYPYTKNPVAGAFKGNAVMIIDVE